MFTVNLEQEELSVEPGATVKLTVAVCNKGDSAGRYALEIEGLDLEWCAIPVPAFTLEPGQETRERILVKPPRSSESRAGVYPFIVTVRSLESGDKVSKQGSVAVGGFNLLTIELTPKRGTVSPMGRSAHFVVMVANLGNTEQHVQLYASDPEDGCTYQFDEERLTLPPGAQKDVGLNAQATSLPVISAPRLYGFGVSARSVENSHVSASTQGQIERKGLLSPATLIALFVVAIVAIAGYFAWPKPARVLTFDVDHDTILEGEEVAISWSAQNATGVRLEFSNELVVKVGQDKGTYRFIPPRSGKLTIYAENGLGRVPGPEKMITVNARPEAAKPEFSEFRVSPTRVKKGQPVTIHFVVKNAVKLVITPLNQEYEPFIENVDVVIPRTGKYELVAVNSEGKTVKKPFQVIVDESDAQIVDFAADPATLPEEGGTVTLRWEVREATDVSIDHGVGTVPDTGTREIELKQTTTFTIEAKDSQGRPTVQKVTVKVQPAANTDGTQ